MAPHLEMNRAVRRVVGVRGETSERLALADVVADLYGGRLYVAIDGIIVAMVDDYDDGESRHTVDCRDGA